mmetsp:Transcript_6070/g.14584  ORF Transcript_6070/g.14584 Transcript_6070/m.14584 type:complete len:85 (-) Transcript_6070:94-348(-)
MQFLRTWGMYTSPRALAHTRSCHTHTHARVKPAGHTHSDGMDAFVLFVCTQQPVEVCIAHIQAGRQAGACVEKGLLCLSVCLCA